MSGRNSGCDRIVDDLTKLAGDGSVTDMLETADTPCRRLAGGTGIEALASLRRAKISIAADRVSVCDFR